MDMRRLAVLATTLLACSSADPTPDYPAPHEDVPQTPGGATPPGVAPPPPAAPHPIAGATKCSVADFEAAHGSFVEARRIRVADDGAVFLQFDDKLHRYTVDAACTFTLDTSFGTGGSLDADTFDLGPAGKVTTETYFGIEVHDRKTGALSFKCDVGGQLGRLAVSADGTTAYTLSEADPAKSKKVVLGPTSCTSITDWVPPMPWATDATGYAESVVLTSDSVVVGAQESVIVYGFDGTQKAVFGHTDTPADWKTFGIAYLGDMIVSSAGIDVVDTNSPSLHRYDAAGTFVKRWSITDLVGAPDTGTLGTRPNAIGVAPNGDRYLAIEAGSGNQMWRLPAF
jgi:hypothetical protein